LNFGIRLLRVTYRGIEMELDFNWVYERDIYLNKTQESKLEKILAVQASEERFYRLLKGIYKRNSRVPFMYDQPWTEKEYVTFVKYGSYPEAVQIALGSQELRETD